MHLGYLGNDARAQARADLAEQIWRAPFSQLLRYGISSFREITDLDVIGIPVWVCYRPLACTISVSCGKNPDRVLSAIGAIVEGIEFWASENPTSDYRLSTYADLDRTAANVLPLKSYPLARDNILDEHTPIPWEIVTQIAHQSPPVWMPSNLIWLRDRIVQQFQDVQQTSNGLASGIDLEDAILQALYEIVERDGWTCEQFVRETLGIPPRKIPLVGLPPELEWTVTLMKRAGLYPILYDCTTDLGLPVIGCGLFGRDGVGLFAGYGCSQNLRVAAQRALLEAAQSRLCFISGARDDLYRRDFLIMKRHSSDKLIEALEHLPPLAPTWNEFAKPHGEFNFDSVRLELASLLARLRNSGIDQLYYQKLAQEDFGGQTLVIVKAIAPQLEGPWFDAWQSNGRAQKHLAREIEKSEHGNQRLA